LARSPKCLVIDADVARSAGGVDAHDERSKNCRDFLVAVLDTGHKVVVTEPIQAEWHKHQSRFTRTWLVSMFAHRRVCKIAAPANIELRSKVEQNCSSEKKRAAMLKDIHLIEAAFQADKIVISIDETVRGCFHETAQFIGVLRLIAWINPCKSEETPIHWLHNGAIPERKRLLGYRPIK
jgi:hypothetical protein